MSMIQIPPTLLPIVQYKPTVKIPKIIHQTYKSIEQLPDVWKDTPQSWRENHPDWIYMFWSDYDARCLVKEKFSWFLETYDNYEYNIQRADAIRPMILYTYGGLYADCDIAAVKPFDDLFYEEHDVYLIRTPNLDFITNSILASKKGVQFWLKVIDEMFSRFEDPPMVPGRHWIVMFSTGPIMLNSVFNNHKDTLDYGMLPKEFILPTTCGTCDLKPCTTNMGYTRLLEGTSWCSFDSHVYNAVKKSYLEIVFVLSVIVAMYYL